jgi:hypothetical protein
VSQVVLDLVPAGKVQATGRRYRSDQGDVRMATLPRERHAIGRPLAHCRAVGLTVRIDIDLTAHH